MSRCRSAALDAASRGWPVLPVYPIRNGRCACSQVDCRHPGKHPIGRLVPHGVRDAVVNERAIDGWFNSWSDANVAIATGNPAGIWVLDVDPRHGGDDELDGLERRNGQLPDTIRALTGGGGLHVYFRMPADGLACATAVRPGIDIKATGGFVLIPPSNHVSGGTYAWEIGCGPGAVALADAPSWLLAMVRERGARLPSTNEPLRLESGERNNGLFRIASMLRARGIGGDAIRESLAAINQRHVVPPLDEAEIASIARSVVRYQPGVRGMKTFLRVAKP